MAYTRQYKTFLNPEKRVGRSEIRPRNIYRITTYKGGDPITKSGEDARYVFVIGKVNNTHIMYIIPYNVYNTHTKMALLSWARGAWVFHKKIVRSRHRLHI